jgi:hypothetical protein
MKKAVINDVTILQGKYDTVFVTRPSMLTNKIHTISFGGVRFEDLADWMEGRMKRMPDNAMVQDAFPHLSKEDREFLMTGITEDEWKTYMVNEEAE